MSKIIITDILWDAPKNAKLPTEVTIDITPDNEYLLKDIDGDYLCDYLSDSYGFCVKGFAAHYDHAEENTTEEKGE